MFRHRSALTPPLPTATAHTHIDFFGGGLVIVCITTDTVYDSCHASAMFIVMKTGLFYDCLTTVSIVVCSCISPAVWFGLVWFGLLWFETH